MELQRKTTNQVIRNIDDIIKRWYTNEQLFLQKMKNENKVIPILIDNFKLANSNTTNKSVPDESDSISNSSEDDMLVIITFRQQIIEIFEHLLKSTSMHVIGSQQRTTDNKTDICNARSRYSNILSHALFACYSQSDLISNCIPPLIYSQSHRNSHLHRNNMSSDIHDLVSKVKTMAVSNANTMISNDKDKLHPHNSSSSNSSNSGSINEGNIPGVKGFLSSSLTPAVALANQHFNDNLNSSLSRMHPLDYTSDVYDMTSILTEFNKLGEFL
jgi:hypothetical protein